MNFVMYKISTRVLLTLLIFSSFSGKVLANGGGNNPPVTMVKIINPLKCSDFECVGQAIIGGLFMIAVPIVSIMVLWGGFQILTAGGDPEKFGNGKKTILYAVVGFAVVLVAQGVVFIIKELLAP